MIVILHQDRRLPWEFLIYRRGVAAWGKVETRVTRLEQRIHESKGRLYTTRSVWLALYFGIVSQQ